eukprot:CAMPEP_0175992754 /NCGR_PEP_ID=MMETSP0108-20121206/53592_1 /TAXON_ID=195067 ORGANISM="Goniomonas pacifica, Strain CCMP1869" /NCGR_SAMPLE_ID=MMETSP0108 /ASSEMBLY_ACC=CAM_ASM_000204 /LENGTH=184 /DNA_ID=CAMNT_0017324481 /DNA_START=362 /DNA_END=913 /DNA_ORIENTATION=-
MFNRKGALAHSQHNGMNCVGWVEEVNDVAFFTLKCDAIIVAADLALVHHPISVHVLRRHGTAKLIVVVEDAREASRGGRHLPSESPFSSVAKSRAMGSTAKGSCTLKCDAIVVADTDPRNSTSTTPPPFTSPVVTALLVSTPQELHALAAATDHENPCPVCKGVMAGQWDVAIEPSSTSVYCLA